MEKNCTVTRAKIYGNFQLKLQNAPFSRAPFAINSLP
jgi:hypothetical protein